MDLSILSIATNVPNFQSLWHTKAPLINFLIYIYKFHRGGGGGLLSIHESLVDLLVVVVAMVMKLEWR